MKLDQYVEETIKQIITGISEAQKFGKQNGTEVNPASGTFNHNNSTGLFCLKTGTPIQQIEFDIVVSVSEGNSTTDSPELTVGSLTASGNSHSTETTNNSTNRIKFSIPVLLPTSGSRR